MERNYWNGTGLKQALYNESTTECAMIMKELMTEVYDNDNKNLISFNEVINFKGETEYEKDVNDIFKRHIEVITDILKDNGDDDKDLGNKFVMKLMFQDNLGIKEIYNQIIDRLIELGSIK